jgi:hypothetical protein
MQVERGRSDAMPCHVRATRIGPHQTKKVLLAEVG